MNETTHRAVIVVGVDGSAGADAALGYAMEEAARRSATVTAVTAVQPPDPLAYEMYVLPGLEEARAAAAAEVRRHVAQLRAQLAASVPVKTLAVTGSPVPVLVEAARDAVLLVVGHRGRGRWRSALLGSVGLGVVLHAPCPVTVVPAPESDADPACSDSVERSVPLSAGPVA